MIGQQLIPEPPFPSLSLNPNQQVAARGYLSTGHLVPSLDPSIRGARRGLPSPISFSGEGIGRAGLGDKDLRAFFFF